MVLTVVRCGNGNDLRNLTAMNIFGDLNEKEVQVFKQWARDNYILGTKVSEMYHPVTQQECDLMNREEAYK